MWAAGASAVELRVRAPAFAAPVERAAAKATVRASLRAVMVRWAATLATAARFRQLHPLRRP